MNTPQEKAPVALHATEAKGGSGINRTGSTVPPSRQAVKGVLTHKGAHRTTYCTGRAIV